MRERGSVEPGRTHRGGRGALFRRGVVTAAQRWLTALVALLLLLAVLGAALVRATHEDRADASARAEQYGAVLAAADTEATAFVNLRYDQAAQGIQAVADGATGDFRAHYVRSARHLASAMQRQRSTLTGHVVSSGVVDLVPDRATVIVATSGTVSNRRTGGHEVPRHFRLRLTLLREGGRWLTSDIAFVGDAA
jgi:Mce-associated membrane protein